MEFEHHHAHGPANRGQVVLTTAAPLFVCEHPGPVHAAVIALHGPHGITAEFERGLNAVATRGYLVAAPYHYFREGGPEYVRVSAARNAYASLSGEEIDADVTGAVEYVTDRRLLRVAAIIGPMAAAAAVNRAGERYPDVTGVTVPGPGDDDLASWLEVAEHLQCVTAWPTGE